MKPVMKRAAMLVACAGLLAGCGGDQFQDLRQFVEEAGRTATATARIEPLPKVTTTEMLVYNPAELEDPFRPRKIEPVKPPRGGLAPDLARRREPLEAFPLDNLRMVGTLQQGKAMFALVRSPDNNLFRVRTNNYIGQNFGLITEITESSIRLRELIQDGNGEWSERITLLQLQEETAGAR